MTEVQVDPSFAAYVDVERIQEIAHEVVAKHASGERQEWVTKKELTVVITDEERVRELNRRYRGEDRPTDVLAFGGTAEGFVEAPGAPSYLGDVIISYPRAQAQAEELGHSPDRELALLVIHGILHLLGYDHSTPEEKAIMWNRQEAILGRVS
ncbi:MAG: rRNA maturation RNase YbeY [Chloroflexota bacterium]|nr:rRNA maturation RNase YbeY [Chloroflexota bacterium]